MTRGAPPDSADLTTLFAAAMAGLGPFAPSPRLAAGVSGGADSLALALLADAWARARGGGLLALIVDHGLRAAAQDEARHAAALLGARGIPARVLTIRDLPPGPRLAERARAARLEALFDACAGAGMTDLLLGQHAADQAETVLIRALSASGPSGLAGIAALREHPRGRVLRPLLGIAPARLRDFLREHGVPWVEDPSNADPAAQRARLRALRADAAGSGPATQALCGAAHALGQARTCAEAATAAWLAAEVSLRAEGFAILPPGPFPPAALAGLIRAIAGTDYPPPAAGVAALAARPVAATLAGTRLMPARHLGPGWLLAREEAALAPSIAARPGAVWDRRFRLGAACPAGLDLGALGADTAQLRACTDLPAAILATLPALRAGDSLFAVPHLGWPNPARCRAVALWPANSLPAAAPPFVVATGTGASGTGQRG